MPALVFPNTNTLRLVLASGLVPARLSGSPARARLDPNHRVWIELAELPWDDLPALAKVGVQALGGSGYATRSVGCWAELLPLVVDHNRADRNRLLFRVPNRLVARFLARLRRVTAEVGVALGTNGQPEQATVVATDVPAGWVDSLLGDDPIEVYREAVAGVWVRWGWRHPLPDHLVVPFEQCLLLSPPTQVVGFGPPPPRPEPEEFVLPRQRPAVGCPLSRLPSVPIRPTLARRATPVPASLWVLDADQAADFWFFTREAAPRTLEALQVALWPEHQGGLLVRSASLRPVHLPYHSVGYAPDEQLARLYLPCDRVLKPTIRPGELARILGLRPGWLAWLGTASDGTVVCHHAPVGVFRPVQDFIEYVAPTPERLTPELGSERFRFARFSLRVEPSSLDEPTEGQPPQASPKPPLTPAREKPGWLLRSLRHIASRFRSRPPPPDQPSASPVKPPGVESQPPVRVRRKLTSSETLVHGHDWTARRQHAEGRLFRDLPRLGPRGRSERWVDLATIYAAVGNPLDAAVCWMNAIWESPSPPANWLAQWLLAECRAAKVPEEFQALERWLSEPGRPGIGRVVAAYTVRSASLSTPPREFLAALPRLLHFLEAHFDDIPVRAVWMARLALARATGGDELGLARWHDRVLNRLRENGPGLDLDEPSFLRFYGTPSADRFPAAREWLIRVREPAMRWVQSHDSGGMLRLAGLDAETEATAAYAQLMFAWGLGCLGERTKARDWVARSRKILSRDAVCGPHAATHALLADLFQLRIREVQEGRKLGLGWPADFRSRFDSLPELARFSIDRLREHSRILEPLDRVRPFRWMELRAFWGTDRLGERLYLLAKRADPFDITTEAESLLELCSRQPTTDTLPRVVLTLLELAPRLPESLLFATLELLPTALEWLEPYLTGCGLWSTDEVSRGSVEYAARMLDAGYSTVAESYADTAASRVAHLTDQLLALGPGSRRAFLRSCGSVFRALSRLGLRGAAEALVRTLDLTDDKTAPSPEQTGLAIGWYVAGDVDAGNRILNRVRDALYLTGTGDHTHLAIAYAAALAYAPQGIAHGRLEELFQRLGPVDARGSTNAFFTLKPLQLIDTVVRSVVTDDRTLGPAVRDWLDDDEFLIRSRIHRDFTTVLRDAGIT